MSAAASAVREMESLIRDVARYGTILTHLASSDSMVEGDALALLGDRLFFDGKKLEKQFEEAVKALHVEARR